MYRFYFLRTKSEQILPSPGHATKASDEDGAGCGEAPGRALPAARGAASSPRRGPATPAAPRPP